MSKCFDLYQVPWNTWVCEPVSFTKKKCPFLSPIVCIKSPSQIPDSKKPWDGFGLRVLDINGDLVSCSAICNDFWLFDELNFLFGMIHNQKQTICSEVSAWQHQKFFLLSIKFSGQKLFCEYTNVHKVWIYRFYAAWNHEFIFINWCYVISCELFLKKYPELSVLLRRKLQQTCFEKNTPIFNKFILKYNDLVWNLNFIMICDQTNDNLKRFFTYYLE